MRTTLILDDELLHEAKKRAADAGLSLSELVNRALRDTLGAPEPEAPPFEMITYGQAGPTVRHEPGELAEELELEDAASLRRER